MQKMIVSDYDDTFYINDEDIINNVNMVNNFMKKNIFVIATGRSYFDFKRKKDMYNINYNYLILNHGATILFNNEIIENKIIDNKIKAQLIKDLEFDHSVNSFSCSELESRLSFEVNDLTKIHIEYINKEIAIKVYNKLINKYSNYLNIFLVMKNKALEIVSNKTNKAIAISKIRDLEKIDQNDIYVIGDSYNDIEMIKKYKGFSMINSVDDVSKISLKQYSSVSDFIKEVLTNKVDE